MPANNFHHERTVSRKFYEMLKAHYPRASINDLALALYEMFTTWRDKDGNAVVDYETLAKIYGKEKQAKSKNFKVKPVLEHFIQVVEPVTKFDYNHNQALARRIKIYWPEEVKQALEAELLQSYHWSGRVFYDGTLFTSKLQLASLDRKRLIALKTLANAPNPLTRKYMQYFNKLPNILFIDMLHNFDDALKLAKKLPNKQENLRVLAQIFDSPKPFLKAVNNSSRSYPIGDNLVTVKNEIRHVLTRNWVEADLKNCQLAIAAANWKVKPIQEFLNTGGDYWQYIADWVDVELTPSNKKMLKQATYAITYGAENRGRYKNKIREALWYLGEERYQRFMSSPMVKALYRAAKKQLKKIEKASGARDCLGNWLPLDKVEVKEDWKDPKKSLLAQINQSYEAMLLYPALELAIKHQDDDNGFFLPLYQYDGFSLVAKKLEQTTYWMKQVKQAIDDNAKRWEINTYLEFSKKTKKRN